MPSGSVIEYQGKRGTVLRIKYRDAEGRQVMETLGRAAEGWTKRKATVELRKRLHLVDHGYRKPASLTFGEYAQRWFQDGPAKRGWKASTIAEYQSVERRLIGAFGSMPLDSVRPRHVAAYVAELACDKGASTVGRDLSLLHSIFKTAVREELVTSGNPAAGAERPRLPRRRWRILEPVEVGRVARAFTDEQARVAFLTLVLTGLRRSELQALRWRDVDLVENVLRVRDSKSEDGIRSIALPPSLAGELLQHLDRSSYQRADERVFCHPEQGTVYRAEAFQEALTAALRAAGVEGRVRPFHDLRHTAITNDAAGGASAIAVMTKAGHANMATTKQYLHLAGVVFRDEAERLERRLLGGVSTEPSTRLSEPGATLAHSASLNGAAPDAADAA